MLEIKRTREGGRLTLALKGSLDAGTSSRLESEEIRLSLIGVKELLLFLFPRILAGVYMGRGDQEALALGAEAVRLYAVSVPLYLIAYLFMNYLMGVHHYRAANIYGLLLSGGVVVPSVWLMVRLMGGRGAWFATPVGLLVMNLGAYLFIKHWKNGDTFNIKRLLLNKDFGVGTGEELNISATGLMEVIGMSHFAGLFCRENGIDGKKANILSLCIEELGHNIIEHGFDDGKPHIIDIRILVKDQDLILRIRDDCRPFNLLERYNLTREQEDPSKNIGIRMVVKSCKDIQYLSTMSTNNLIIRI